MKDRQPDGPVTHHYVLTIQGKWQHGVPDQQEVQVISESGLYTVSNVQTRSDIFVHLFDRLVLTLDMGFGDPVVLFWSLEREAL
jgi:hypothetical protein